MSEKDPNFIIAMLEGTNAMRWMILGIVLLGLELATGTTYILWIASAAILMTGVTFILPIGWEMQFLIFFLLSIVLLVVGHKYVRPRFKGGEPSELNDRARAMVGLRVKAVSDFDVGKGRVQVGDSQWSARLETGNAKTGDELEVVSVKGATLQVKKSV